MNIFILILIVIIFIALISMFISIAWPLLLLGVVLYAISSIFRPKQKNNYDSYDSMYCEGDRCDGDIIDVEYTEEDL